MSLDQTQINQLSHLIECTVNGAVGGARGGSDANRNLAFSSQNREAIFEFVRTLLQTEEKRVRLKVVKELRSSSFLHCDVNKEDVLLCIEHGCTLIEAKALALNSGR